MIKTYSELITYNTYSDRLEYLKHYNIVGKKTFDHERYLNQKFYKSIVWKHLRNYVITRDLGCDLGLLDIPILGRVIVHHMNPITSDDILRGTDALLNPEYLISTSHETHQIITYGTAAVEISNRFEGDTCPWKIQKR